MSTVASVKVKDDVLKSVSEAMNLANWQKHVKGDNIVLKVNVVWDKLYPSCTTTPMVIEGVLKEVSRMKPKKITIVDTNTAAGMYADRSFRVQGIDRLAMKYGAICLCLSYDKFQVVNNPGAVKLKHLKVSETLLNADSIITMPVLKTHQITKMTGALKNQWGCIHDLRHNYHLFVDQAIADVNKFFKSRITFGVMDALYGMEGKGPKSGDPLEVGYVFASNDLVAIDSVAAEVMGFKPEEIEHLMYAQKAGVGTIHPKIVGDPIPHLKFRRADYNIVIGSEMMLRHTPRAITHFIFQTKFFNIPRLAAQIYYDIWYGFVGKKKVDKMMAGKYGQMWKKYL